jgi:hypothetical protein
VSGTHARGLAYNLLRRHLSIGRRAMGAVEKAALTHAVPDEMKRRQERDAVREKLDDSVNGIYYAVRAAQRYLTMGRLEQFTMQIGRCRDAADTIHKCLPIPPKLSRSARFQAHAARVYEALKNAWGVALGCAATGGVLGGVAGAIYAGKPDTCASGAAYGAGYGALVFGLSLLGETSGAREIDRKREQARQECVNMAGSIAGRLDRMKEILVGVEWLGPSSSCDEAFRMLDDAEEAAAALKKKVSEWHF